ncbi:MAG: hypothetical protein ABI696_16385 [Rubrivivax sp.]
MFVWRNALILGLIFMVIGVTYFFLNGPTLGLDVAGATMLVVLGFAMAFVFAVLLRGSREL